MASPQQNSERGLETLNRQVHVALDRQSLQLDTGICFCGCAVVEFVGVVRLPLLGSFRFLSFTYLLLKLASPRFLARLSRRLSWVASACARADCKQLPLRGARAAEVSENSFVSTVLEALPCSPVSAFREALETPAALAGGIAVESQASLDIVGPWMSSDNPGVGEFS